jgi:putative DNA primase/helicase
MPTASGILGDSCIATPIETFPESKADPHPTELARMRGARLVTATETEAGKHWAESRLKEITGGERVPARFMHKDFFEYEKLVIDSKTGEVLRDVSHPLSEHRGRGCAKRPPQKEITFSPHLIEP